MVVDDPLDELLGTRDLPLWRKNLLAIVIVLAVLALLIRYSLAGF